VTSKTGAPIAPEVAAMLKEKGHAVSDLKTEKGALDAVFREITRGGSAAAKTETANA